MQTSLGRVRKAIREGLYFSNRVVLGIGWFWAEFFTKKRKDIKFFIFLCFFGIFSNFYVCTYLFVSLNYWFYVKVVHKFLRCLCSLTGQIFVNGLKFCTIGGMVV
jgi:hypothetical protein